MLVCWSATVRACVFLLECSAVCESNQEETSAGDGGCAETFHHSPAVLQEQMETCLWHVHMHARVRACVREHICMRVAHKHTRLG